MIHKLNRENNSIKPYLVIHIKMGKVNTPYPLHIIVRKDQGSLPAVFNLA